MNIELATGSEKAPLEVLDFDVIPRLAAGQSSLLVRLLCRRGVQDNHLKLPPLSWYDASQLQRFSQQLAAARHPETVQTDLVDAGLRLTGSVRRVAGHWSNGRTIQVEPLPNASKNFAPFTIHASNHDIRTYSTKLYNRLWEAFTRG